MAALYFYFTKIVICTNIVICIDCQFLLPPENTFIPSESAHSICLTDEYRLDGKKLRARTCAVCSWRYKQKQIKRANVTTKYCLKCSKKTPNEKRVFLCTEQRPDLNSNSCYSVWHTYWKCRHPPVGELMTFHAKVEQKCKAQDDQVDKETDVEISDGDQGGSAEDSATESEVEDGRADYSSCGSQEYA